MQPYDRVGRDLQVMHGNDAGERCGREQTGPQREVGLAGADHIQTVGQRSQRDRQEAEPFEVERRMVNGFLIRDEGKYQCHTHDTQWHIDIENPAPGRGAGDQTAQGRPEYRREQCGPDESGQRLHEIPLLGIAQDDQAAHGRHHRSGSALDDARSDKCEKGRRYAARHRRQRE